MKAILRLSRLDKLRHSDHSRINILCLRRNSSSREGQSEAEQRSIRNARDQKERQAAIHTPDTTSVRHTVSLTCQGALANTGQHRGQSQTGDASQTGRECEKEPLGSIYHHACYPEPNQGTNAWPLLIFQNFAYAVLSTQDGHQDKTSGRCHFFHHNPSSEGACFRTRGRMLPHTGENL